MRRNLHCLLLILFTFSITALSQNAAKDVQVKLSLSGGKTVYRMGEPIRLVLSFTAQGDGEYTVDAGTSVLASSHDEAVLSPASGVFEWAKEYRNEDSYLPNPLLFRLSAAPIEVELSLNGFVRFDKPGKYSVRLKTKRVSTGDFVKKTWSQLSLTTNAAAFEIREMSDADEQEEVKRLSASLDAKRGSLEENKITEELAYLCGDASTREKVKLFLTLQRGSENIQFGLFIARNRALVIKLLEDALLLPRAGKEISFKLLDTLAKLQVLEEFANSGTPANIDAEELARRKITRFLEIRKIYLEKMN